MFLWDIGLKTDHSSSEHITVLVSAAPVTQHEIPSHQLLWLEKVMKQPRTS